MLMKIAFSVVIFRFLRPFPVGDKIQITNLRFPKISHGFVFCLGQNRGK
jgi:hypothetical protein